MKVMPVLKMAIGSGLLFVATVAMAMDRYHHHFPEYVELCALSQKATVGEPREKPWGHSVLYLHGACRDRSAGFPQLRLCDEGTDDGVIVSVNSLLKNVNWIAVSGRDFAIYGELVQGETLNGLVVERTIQKLIDERVYEGVEIHDVDPQSKNRVRGDKFRILARSSVGIDVATAFGRDSYCARLPVTKPVLSEVISYLNQRNRNIFEGREAPFLWNGIYNNCAHLAHNALASVGVWESKKTDQDWHEQVFNLAVPANEFIDFVRATNRPVPESPLEIYGNETLRRIFMKFDWLPFQHGSTTIVRKRYEPNDLYHGDLEIFVLNLPFRDNKAFFAEATNSLQYLDLKEDLNWHGKQYEDAISRWRGVDVYVQEWLERRANEDWDVSELTDFLGRYFGYLQRQTADVTSRLERFKKFDHFSVK